MKKYQIKISTTKTFITYLGILHLNLRYRTVIVKSLDF